MSSILNVDLVTTIFCYISMKMQQKKYNMFFKLLIQPTLDTVTTLYKIYYSTSFPFDVHIHQSYVLFAFVDSKNIVHRVLFILHKESGLQSKEITTYTCLDCFTMAKQDESGSTDVTLSLQVLHKINPKGLGVHTFTHNYSEI